MNLSEYQRRAARTDQLSTPAHAGTGRPQKAELVPLLGLTGEIGSLLSEYKKLLRDGPVHLRFRDQLAEELGDTMWYVASVATKFGLSLEEIAAANLKKTTNRWLQPRQRNPYDARRQAKERLPLSFRYRFQYGTRADGTPAVALIDERGKQIGDLLTDNSHEDDGYRFHDVMHFAFVAILGWSPVARKVLDKKRRTHPRINEVEDGGRATVIDEAIVAMVFDYIQHDLQATAGMTRIDSETLRGIRALTRGFEVHSRTESQWEEAILKGLDVWRRVEANDGGIVIGNFATRTFKYAPPGTRKTVGRRRS
jgi:NTP pyrophosphatase (non-canonical NTP hydrolase)